MSSCQRRDEPGTQPVILSCVQSVCNREAPAILTVKLENTPNNLAYKDIRKIAQQQSDAQLPILLEGKESCQLIHQHMVDSYINQTDDLGKSIRDTILPTVFRKYIQG